MKNVSDFVLHLFDTVIFYFLLFVFFIVYYPIALKCFILIIFLFAVKDKVEYFQS